MKPVFVMVLVVSVSACAFLAGRMSVTPTVATKPTSIAMPAPAPGAVTSLGGRIAEIIQVPNYTYLRLATARGDAWAAISTNTVVKQGEVVTLANAMAMHGFNSPTLKRTFDTIYFAQFAAR